MHHRQNPCLDGPYHVWTTSANSKLLFEAGCAEISVVMVGCAALRTCSLACLLFSSVLSHFFLVMLSLRLIISSFHLFNATRVACDPSSVGREQRRVFGIINFPFAKVASPYIAHGWLQFTLPCLRFKSNTSRALTHEEWGQVTPPSDPSSYVSSPSGVEADRTVRFDNSCLVEVVGD